MISFQIYGSTEQSPGWKIAGICIVLSFETLEIDGYVFSFKHSTPTHSISGISCCWFPAGRAQECWKNADVPVYPYKNLYLIILKLVTVVIRQKVPFLFLKFCP